MNTRKYWIETMLKIADPVLTALANRELRIKMPVEHHSSVNDRESCTYLEALGRTVMGIAPWLNVTATGSEETLRQKYAQLTREAITAAVESESPDKMNFSIGAQPIVDAAFLAQGILRAPQELYEPLSDKTKRELIERMKETRTRKPFFSNWLLFSAMIETFLCYAGESDWDSMRIDFALKQHLQWYKGNGVYGDGPNFSFDYYNSYVIQPMLLDILHTIGDRYDDWRSIIPLVEKRASLAARVQERLIMPDGTYPVLGRSSAYRFGAFQLLAQGALLNNLGSLSPAQVRCALTAVLQKVTAFEAMFDEQGWLTIGVCGHQPDMGETYISTGSLYLCCAVFLPLGLPETDAFWSAPDESWTQKKMWNGENLMHDSLYE